MPVLDGLLTLLGYLAFATFAAITLFNIINNNAGGGRSLTGIGTEAEVAAVARRVHALVSSGARLLQELAELATDFERPGTGQPDTRRSVPVWESVN